MEGQVKATTTGHQNNLSNTETLLELLVKAVSQTLVCQNMDQVTMTTKMMHRISKVSPMVFKVRTLVFIAMKTKATIPGVKVIIIFKVNISIIKVRVSKVIFTTDKVTKVTSLVQLIMVTMATIKVRVSMGLSRDIPT